MERRPSNKKIGTHRASLSNSSEHDDSSPDDQNSPRTSADGGHRLQFTDEPLTPLARTESAMPGGITMNFGEVSSVDVDDAKSRYAALGRTLSHNSVRPSIGKIEEGAAPAGIDLEEYLNNRLDKAKELGIRHKRLGVAFRNLTVIGNSTTREHIQTFWTPFYRPMRDLGVMLHLLPKPDPGIPFEILHDITGLCADGEMVLVLGKPGSGCSTLLRVLANHRRTYKEIRGAVTYGGIPAEEMDQYKGEIAYNQEDDVHYPTLTVKNTLEFVCKCRTPSEEYVKDPKTFIDEMVNTTCQVFGLTHCKNTQVGNAMIRGVSGGERKRLSIAEQVVSMATVGIWDGSTKGLDASTALDFVRSLRIASDVLQRTTFATFYQASESIYELFDKVMVLDQGYCLYFGPTTTAKSYFEGIGLECPARMTTPDFLTGVTQLRERTIRSGFEDMVPKTAQEFDTQFKASPEYTNILQEIDTYEHGLQEERPDVEFREAVTQAKHKGVKKRSAYMTPYRHQLMACLAREFHLLYGGRGETITRLVSNTIKAIIIGSLFFKLPLDSSGAFTRGGALFVSLLFNALSSQSELPKSFFGRGVLYKHKSLALYHPSAFYIAQVIADVPRLLLFVGSFALLIYWMTGFHSTAAAFFTFFFALFVLSMAMTALFRFQYFAGIFLLSFLVYAGYIIPLKDMKGWFIWIRYINPLAWGLEALLLNEFKDLTFHCSPPALLPYGPGYDDLRYKTCTLAGASPGSNEVLGRDYMRTQLSAHVSMLWPDIGGYSTNIYKARLPKSTRHGKEIGPDGKPVAIRPGYEGDMKITYFLWNHISYTVPFKSDPGGKRRLLDNIAGWVRPGELVALMGSSGAGKTTLLDVLAQRKSVGVVNGDIRLQNHIPGDDFRLLTGYCEQLDVHNPYATVRETLRFSASLRQPQSVSTAEKNSYVDYIINLLELNNIAHAMIGELETGRGISAEERKRVSIAMELVAKPTILFLDEPTSGLDAQASFTIVSLIKRLAEQGQAIICTIHQPSAILFEHFDKLLLLARGGKTVYFGKIGMDARILISYFERNGAPACPPTANPAEYILDAVGAGVSASVSQDWPQIWNSSPEANEVQLAVDQYEAACERAVAEEEARNKREHKKKKKPASYQTNSIVQATIVVKRMILNYWRMPDYNFGRLLHQVIVALILGFTFYRLDYSKDALLNRSFAIFQTSVLGIIVVNDVMPQFFQQRTLFRRESSAGYYSWWVFTTAMIAAEIPYIVFEATVFFAINFYLTNYNPASDRAIYFYLMYIAFSLFMAFLGQAMAAMTPNLPVAMLVAPFIASMMGNFSGIMIPESAMPTFWRRWMYWVDPYHYAIEGLITNDMYGKKITCKNEEFNILQPPPGKSCGEYMANFLKTGPGYISNPSATSDCRYCQYKMGNEFFEPLGWDFTHRWRNFGIIIAFAVFNIFLVYLFMIRYRNTGQKINKIKKSSGKEPAASDQVVNMPVITAPIPMRETPQPEPQLNDLDVRETIDRTEVFHNLV
ncbi:ABC-2 type transporter-domain-containing protein [Syncephalis fuscata]|nr:ABC-2 type transporter-domain-containing protein [Syncephalis fuscata]